MAKEFEADEANKALAKQIVKRYLDDYINDYQLENQFAAALAQACKEGAQPIHPDDLADMINKFLFEQYACTIDHPQMHVLKELVQWWPDPASKQER